MFALVMDGESRIFQIADAKFDVAPPLQWVVCSANAVEDWQYVEGVVTAPPTLSLNEIKTTKIAELTQTCSTTILSGYQSDALGSTHIYPSGVTDQINMMGSVTASLLPNLAAEWKTPFWCADDAGSWDFRGHTVAQIQQAGSDGKAHIVTCQTTLAQLSGVVMAANTAAKVNDVMWP